MITGLMEKSSGDNFTYREGKVPCKPWGIEIPVMLFDETVTLEYTGNSPWGDHSDEFWNYATQI